MISSHILDTSIGAPAKNVAIILEKKVDDVWTTIGTAVTNADGRVSFDCEKATGIYCLRFGLESYYKNTDDFFFMDTPVIFKVTDVSRKYHVPLLLNPYGYTTYRGS